MIDSPESTSFITMFKNQAAMMASAIAVACSVILTSTATAVETCEPQWDTTFGQPGMDDRVSALTVFDDGSGPALYAAGRFTNAGGVSANRIAKWDGTEWSALGSGMSGESLALTVWNGDLIACGRFTTAGGQTVNHIARWDGETWHPFTSGGEIGVGGSSWIWMYALTVWNGDLITGGDNFTTAGGQTVNRIARWDGSAWHPFTSGGQIGVDNTVFALTVWNGDLIAGGFFTTAGGQTVNRIARWDGSAWHPFTSSGGQIGVGGGSNPRVHALTVWNGDLIAGGEFTTAGGQTVNRIARWDGSAWHPFTLGGQIGVNDIVRVLTVWNGDLIAGGDFTTAGGETVNHIARWDGSAWHPFTSGGQIGVGGRGWIWVRALTVWKGDLIAGGRFTTAGGQTVNRIARWDGCLDAPVPGDLNGDGVVDVSDLLILLGAWGVCPDPSDCPADLNGDGTVDVSDLLILLANWG